MLQTLQDLVCCFLQKPNRWDGDAAAVCSGTSLKCAWETCDLPYGAGWWLAASVFSSLHEIYSMAKICGNMKFLGNTYILLWSYHHCCKKQKNQKKPKKPPKPKRMQIRVASVRCATREKLTLLKYFMKKQEHFVCVCNLSSYNCDEFFQRNTLSQSLEKPALAMSAMSNAAGCSWRQMHSLDNCPLYCKPLEFSVIVVKCQWETLESTINPFLELQYIFL